MKKKNVLQIFLLIIGVMFISKIHCKASTNTLPFNHMCDIKLISSLDKDTTIYNNMYIYNVSNTLRQSFDYFKDNSNFSFIEIERNVYTGHSDTLYVFANDDFFVKFHYVVSKDWLFLDYADIRSGININAELFPVGKTKIEVCESIDLDDNNYSLVRINELENTVFLNLFFDEINCNRIVIRNDGL